jgi:hypothetical protein
VDWNKRGSFIFAGDHFSLAFVDKDEGSVAAAAEVERITGGYAAAVEGNWSCNVFFVWCPWSFFHNFSSSVTSQGTAYDQVSCQVAIH